MDKDEIKKLSIETVDREFDRLWKLASYIHANPEIAFEEKKAAHALSSYLQEQGFAVKTGIAGLDTAFQAVFKKGNGPRIAVFAEYDALKGLGHACGHNLIATSALGCAAAVKQVLESSELEGSIEVYGTPAEEDGGGKIIMLKQGVFDGLDAVFLMHPTSVRVHTQNPIRKMASMHWMRRICFIRQWDLPGSSCVILFISAVS